MSDLPPGSHGVALVGPYWPQPPTALRDGTTHWAMQSREQLDYANSLRNQQALLSRNKGVTAEDLLQRFSDGARFHDGLAEKFDIKSKASDRAADCVDALRGTLSRIARDGSRDIDAIWSSKQSTPAKLAAIHAKQAECAASAADASALQCANIEREVQNVLNAEFGAGAVNAKTWLADNGHTVSPQAPEPITEKSFRNEGGALSDVRTAANPDAPESHPPAAPLSDVRGTPAAPPPAAGPKDSTTPLSDVRTPNPSAAPAPAPAVPAAPQGGAPVPAAPHMPPAAAASSSPAGHLGSEGLSPQSLARSAEVGMAAGAPAAAGTHQLAQGTIQAATTGQTQPAAPLEVAPPVPPAHASVPAHFTGLAAEPTASLAAADNPSFTAGHSGVPVVGPVASPVPTPPVAPPTGGPLPAYGADLRPAVPTAPPPLAAPSAPPMGSGGAPTAATGPTGGASLMSPTEQRQPVRPTGTGAASTPPVGAAELATTAATTGAGTGALAREQAEQERLQLVVAAAARQAPGLTWVAGLRDDWATTVLVTDVAGGWIPPQVQLPRGVTLLEPANRRSSLTAAELVGTTVTLVVHQPNGYTGNPAPDEPPLTGERARYGHPADDLAPTLAAVARGWPSLPAVVLLAAQQAQRGGIAADEIAQVRQFAADVRRSVLSDYPHHHREAAATWMLAAAVEALIDGDRQAAAYHLAWAQVSRVSRR
ncbi:DUF5632 domain-containing protein [Mycolicibacterium sp. NCC-Tsukiji]|uniref:DUF5632 domain-containing protein n=1 Tax=Mycolicibacterium sp. NCC-Tsukiji TaxID=2185272 RepID=UPI000ED4754B|nr:DUF5632 domain-containing protein [Mycolicibacterium sp. NCC-Tsukiji]GCB01890.1 hypothetical protein NCCNTM_55240 [Mycolicibacterium sp. NCC-Tsukiji]